MNDERHEPCQCKKRKKIITAKGFKLECKECGHTFKEITKIKTLKRDFLKE